jgi:hypothetical protein
MSKIEEIEAIYAKAEAGLSAEVVLRALEPALERRLGVLLELFASTPAELGPILDLRARIAEVWRMRKELKAVKQRGESAQEAITRIIEGVNHNGTAK